MDRACKERNSRNNTDSNVWRGGGDGEVNRRKKEGVHGRGQKRVSLISAQRDISNQRGLRWSGAWTARRGGL